MLQIYTPKPIDWSLSYSKNAKKPFGTSALHEMLTHIFPNQIIIDSKRPLYNTLIENTSTNQNLIIINSEFNPDTLDTRELLKFVARGNTIFIAANYFDEKFADTLKIATTNIYETPKQTNNDTLAIPNFYKSYDTLKTNFVNLNLKNDTSYVYVKGIEGTFFKTIDSGKSIVLGEDEKGNINFIKTSIGKGNIFIHTVPEVYSNYHFVNKNYSYVYKALSYLPNQKTIWDEYYKIDNVESDSPLRVIFANPLLLKAYYLLLLSLILFIIFGIKRKQRIIPVIEPYQNTTLKFIDIVGTLYFQTGNHKNIADKKINYFLEFIRTTFKTKTTIYDDAFLSKISAISGVDFQQNKDLFYYIAELSNKEKVTEYELLKLNTLIEIFHTANQRK
ncbi:MAG: DUF4350 domain-containing protein [Bacteroidia bacterium]